MKEHVKCLIIGSGPAGYTAAIYASRANLAPVEYSGMQPGGQLTQTTEVENFPGYPEGVMGQQMMDDLRQQALRFGADIRDGEIVEVDFSARPYKATDSEGRELEADTVIIATGASAKYLGLEDEKKYAGLGVSACATCDGFFYRKRTVAVVGGGDTACEDALYLAGLAKKVYLIVRKPYLRASKVMQQRVMDVKRKGEPDEQLVDIAIDGFFLAIGHKPNTDIFRQWLPMDEVGYLKKIDGTPRTVLPGIFVAGDCADPTYRQAITAAGTGCQAAIEAERFLLGQ